MMKRKIAVIGLDGLGWNILKDILDRGYMPFLRRRILRRAICGKITSLITPDTPPTWISLSTGVNPGIHGIPQGCLIDGKNVKIVSSLDVEFPRIHHMLAFLGVKSLVYNMYLTYPPIGRSKYVTMLIDRFSPKTIILPDNYSKMLNDYRSYNAPDQWPNVHNPILDFDSYLESLSRGLESRINALLMLSSLSDWDLLWAEFHEPDLILHVMYHYVLSKMSNNFAKIFTLFDKLIKTLCRKVDMVFIVSDHGFASYRYKINVGRLLYELGFFKKQLSSFSCFYNTLRNAFTEILYSNYYTRHIYGSLLKPFYKIRASNFRKGLINGNGTTLMDNSVAFIHPCNIRGVVIKRPNMVDEVIKALSNMWGMLKVLRREEVYHGPYVKRAPELLLFPHYDLGVTLSDQHSYTDLRLIMKGKFYDHHPEGIFIALSDQIISGNKNNFITISHYDIVPTILYYLDLPVPNRTDGRIIYQLMPENKTGIIRYKDYLSRYKIVKNILKSKSKLRLGKNPTD